MEFFKEKIYNPEDLTKKNTAETKTWESKTSVLSKEFLKKIDDEFSQISAKLVKLIIENSDEIENKNNIENNNDEEWVGETESGGQIYLTKEEESEVKPAIQKKLTTKKLIGETESGGQVYENSPLDDFTDKMIRFNKDWREKIKNEKKLTIKEKKILLNNLKLRINNLKNQIFDAYHGINPKQSKEEITITAEKMISAIETDIKKTEEEEQKIIEVFESIVEIFNQPLKTKNADTQKKLYLIKQTAQDIGLSPKDIVNSIYTDLPKNPQTEEIYEQIIKSFEEETFDETEINSKPANA